MILATVSGGALLARLASGGALLATLLTWASPPHMCGGLAQESSVPLRLKLSDPGHGSGHGSGHGIRACARE